MESLGHPLEQRSYLWLLANHSVEANASHYPPFFPYPRQQEELSFLPEESTGFFSSTFQDLSLGFISVFMLQKSFKNLDVQHKQTNLLYEKLKFRFYDIILTNVIKTIVGALLLVVSLPLVLPVVCLFWLTSSVVKIVYALRFGQKVSKVEGMDGIWGLESKESRPFIITCMLLEGEPDIAKIRQHIITKVLDVRDENNGDYKFKKFRQTFSLRYGYYMWRDAKALDIKEHVKIYDLRDFYLEEPKGAAADDGQKSEQAENATKKVSSKKLADDFLHRFLSEESAAALSNDRPPWEVLALVRGDGRYNIVIRIHHAIGDGVSLMRVCVETLIDTPLPPPSVGPRRVNPFVRAAMMVWSALVLPFGLLQVVANFDHNALHGVPLSGKKVIASSSGLPLPVLKRIKVAAGATVNDVLMSCLSAALSKHFTRRKEEVSQVTAVVPVSFHDLSAPVALTNQFSVATVKMPSASTQDATSRLKATKALLDGMKRDPTLLAVFGVVRAVSHVLPAPVAELLLSGRGVTVAASNVPGPQQEIEVWGDKVEGIQFWVPNRSPVGVGFSFASYMGVVTVGLNVDAALVNSREEAQQILDDVEDEMYALHGKLVSPV